MKTPKRATRHKLEVNARRAALIEAAAICEAMRWEKSRAAQGPDTALYLKVRILALAEKEETSS